MLIKNTTEPNAFYTLMAGGLAGTFSWLVSFPVDVVKSRLQTDGMDGKTKYSGAMDCLRKSYKAEGYTFLTRGLASTLLRAFPMNAVCFLVVSYVLKFCDRSNLEVSIPNTAAQYQLVDTYTSPFMMRVQINDQQKHNKTKLNTVKYLIFLSGFHEAVCSDEMVELVEQLHGEPNEGCYYLMEDVDLINKYSRNQRFMLLSD